MAIEFIKSKDIQVFPAVHRATEHGISKKTTEENLIKFGKLSSNKANLSQMFEDPDDSSYVIFNIAGYWFRCLEEKIPSGNNLYAYIALIKAPIIGYILTPTDSLTVGGVLDDIVGADTDKSFKGLAFTEDGDGVPNNGGGVVYYGLQIRDSVGDPIYQNLKLDTSEIRNTASDAKHIGEKFDTRTLTAQTINGLTIEATTGTLDIADGKTVNAYVDLDVGAASTNTGKVTIQSAGSYETKITGPNNGSTTLLGGEMVEKDATQTLTNKTLKTPKINDISSNNTYNIAVSELAANRTVTLPPLGANDEFVFKDFTQTLTNKTLTTPKITAGSFTYNFAPSTIAASRTITLPLLTANDEFVFKDFTQTLSKKTFVAPVLGAATATSINKVEITAPANYATLAITDKKTLTASDTTTLATNTITLGNGKKLTISDNTALATNAITLASGKSLTMQYAGLKIGGSNKTGDITLMSNNNTPRTLTLNGSPALAGTGTLALNKNLTVNGAEKTLAGAGTTLTFENNFTTGANAITLNTTGTTKITLPTTGTLATLNEKETLTQKTLTSPILTTPKINDSDARYTYNIAVSELAADRTITLPLLTGNDEFVFKDFTQTLKNKTLTSPTINTSDINGGTVDSLTSLSIRDTSAAFDVTIAGTSSTALTAGRKLTLDIVNADKTIKLTGSPSLSGITTTGSGKLALNKDLTVANTNNITLEAVGADRILKISGADKTLAGAATTLTFAGNFTTTGANAITLNTSGTTNITLPVSGTLATISDIDNIKRDISDKAPLINNYYSYDTNTSIYAPTSGGTSGYLLVATKSTSAPTWTSPSNITVGNAINTAFTNTTWAATVTAINGTLPSSVLGKTLEIGVMYDDGMEQSRYYNFGIITLRPLGHSDSEYYVGAIYAGSTTYSLTIGSDWVVHFKNGTTPITGGYYKLHYRIIT